MNPKLLFKKKPAEPKAPVAPVEKYRARVMGNEVDGYSYHLLAFGIPYGHKDGFVSSYGATQAAKKALELARKREATKLNFYVD